MSVKGREYCAYCNIEFDFEVDEKDWIVPCKFCGRPTILCDKCRTMYGEKNCLKCPYRKKLDEKMKEWEKGEIGKVLYVDKHRFWLNEGVKSGWHKVVGFDDNYQYLLENIENGKKVATYGELVDFSRKFDKDS